MSQHDDDDHDHHHGHSHDAGHAHLPDRLGRTFALGVALNLGFVAVETGYGLAADSLGLLADAGHNFADVLSLLLAWGATWLAGRRPTGRRTYGMGRVTILAALANAALLLVGIGAIVVESLRRLGDPQPVEVGTVMAVAAVGIAINTGTALLFLKGSKGDLNLRAAFQHMAADAAVSAGVVVAALLIGVTGWLWLDPLIALAIALVIASGAWSLLRESLDLALDAVPAGIDRGAVHDYLVGLPGVEGLHDLHIWPLSTHSVALTAHLVMPNGTAGDGFLHDVAETLHHRFAIDHATLQVERDVAAAAAHCPLVGVHAIAGE